MSGAFQSSAFQSSAFQTLVTTVVSVPAAIYTALQSLVSGRAYPNTLPQDLPALPAIRYQIKARRPDPDLCGTGTVVTDDTDVVIECYAKTHGAALALRDSVITQMLGTTPPARRANSAQSFDPDMKAHRIALNYTFSASTAT